jgi:disulfide bond formation protein DsbB
MPDFLNLLPLNTMKLFFALLALLTNAAVVYYTVIAVAAPWSTRAMDLKESFYELVYDQELLFGALVAGTATIGSLYLSEIADLPPCRLCWFQRYAMYPIAAVLVVAAWRREPRVRIPVLLTAIVGGGLAAYHYLIQWVPALDSNACSIELPCTAAWFRVFGFISIPYMALSGFAFVIVMMISLRWNQMRPITDSVE